MKWKKVKIKTDNGIYKEAYAPVIISASRATDIPAFYSDWFFHRLKKGYIKRINPFNGKPYYISFQNTRVIVFWSKNPNNIINKLHLLDNKGINYYFHFTLNYYDKDLEPFLPPIDNRIETFIKLSQKIGKQKVIWRFDPYILTDKYDIDLLIKRTEYIGDRIYKYTEKLVFSFADISIYRKVRKNLNLANIHYKEFTELKMHQLAEKLSKLNKKWNLELATCAEKIDLTVYRIKHNKCIDDELMVRLFNQDKVLMNFIGYEPDSIYPLNEYSHNNIIYRYKIKKDKNQRANCGCVMSMDIGQYNTCPYGCVYCYANNSIELARSNYKKYTKNPYGESILL